MTIALFNLWFLMVAVSNLLVLVGSLIKILLNLNVRYCIYKYIYSPLHLVSMVTKTAFHYVLLEFFSIY